MFIITGLFLCELTNILCGGARGAVFPSFWVKNRMPRAAEILQ